MMPQISLTLQEEISRYRARIREKYPNQQWSQIHCYNVMVKQLGDMVVAAELGRSIEKDVIQMVAAGLEYLERVK